MEDDAVFIIYATKFLYSPFFWGEDTDFLYGHLTSFEGKFMKIKSKMHKIYFFVLSQSTSSFLKLFKKLLHDNDYDKSLILKITCPHNFMCVHHDKASFSLNFLTHIFSILLSSWQIHKKKAELGNHLCFSSQWHFPDCFYAQLWHSLRGN